MSKITDIRNVALRNAGWVTSSPGDWMRFLDTASRVYRFSFSDQLLIYAQQPQSTACASLETWNNKMNRWVNRGAKGIALIDDTVQPPKLHYVFDISNTHAVRNADEPYVWKLEERHSAALRSHLAEAYVLNSEQSIDGILRNISEQTVAESVDEAMSGIRQAMQGTKYAGLSYDEQRVIVMKTLQATVCYTVARRCGLDAGRLVPESDLSGIGYFNSMAILTVFGNAAARLSEGILIDIGREIRKFDKEKTAQPLAKKQERVYNDFSKLERESGNLTQHNQNMRGGIKHGTDVHTQGRLSVSGSGDRERGDEADREVGTVEEELPEREQTRLVSEHAADRRTGQPLGGYRGRSADEVRETDRAAAAGESRPEQGSRSDDLDSAHEQSDGAGGGDHPKRIDHLLTEEESDEAEAEMASALSLPETPSVQEQIEAISRRVLPPISVDSALPPEVFDVFLRTGSGRRDSVQRLIYYMSVDLSEEKKLELLKKEYMSGAKGLIVDGRQYAMTYDETGMRFAAGNTVIGNPVVTKLSWEQVYTRINELLDAGQYARQGVIDAMTKQILTEYAGTLWYMKRDLREDVAKETFADLGFDGSSFDDEIAKIVTALETPEQRNEIILRLDSLSAMYKADPSVIRFPMYRPDRTAELFHRLDLEQKSYTAEPGSIPDDYRQFITSDQIDMVLASGGPYSASRLSVYSCFCRNGDEKVRTEYLKDFFGTGGRSPALRYNDQIAVEYDARGMQINLGRFAGSEESVLLKWSDVAGRIDNLIRNDRYLTAQDHEHMPEYERRQLALAIADFYDRLPEGVSAPFPQMEQSDRINHIERLLENENSTVDLLDNMTDVVAATPFDDRRYRSRLKTYTDLKDYSEGNYTLFPAMQDGEQLSMQSLFENAEQENIQDIKQDSGQDAAQNEVSVSPDELELKTGMRFEVDGRSFEIDSISDISRNVSLADVTFKDSTRFPIFRVEAYQTVLRWVQAQQQREQREEALPSAEKLNYHIDASVKKSWNTRENCSRNIEAIRLLKQLEADDRLADPAEQAVLAGYVGWGGIPQAFDPNSREWESEYSALRSLLTAEEFDAARSTTLNAFYTDPGIARAIYEKLEQMGLKEGNILEPSCGIGNFMGALPQTLNSVNMFGVELDSLTGRIAKQLYQKNQIFVQGFEDTNLPDSFFDCVVGNVPFGNYQVADRKYDRYSFLIHDYFIAKSLDLVRPGGIVAVITSSGTMDKQNDSARRYLAERADLLGAIRLPNNAFSENANTNVVTDILFLQKRESRAVDIPEWVSVMTGENGITMNKYFFAHPEMVLGTPILRSGRYGEEMTVEPINGDLQAQLREAMTRFDGTITVQEITDTDLTEPDLSVPADPEVRNFSYTNLNGSVYYRENSRMMPISLPQTTADRVLAMIDMRNTTQHLLQAQLDDEPDERISSLQKQLSEQYDEFSAKYGLINSSVNRRAFSQDSSYCLLASLEILDEDGNLKRKADIFTKRTIRKAEPVHSVETASETLALSLSEKACVNLDFMSELCGKSKDEITDELTGVIFRNPVSGRWETGDEYLSGNVREKLHEAEEAAQVDPAYAPNAEYLRHVQPKDLEASDIEVRLGATWISPEHIDTFMREVLHTPFYYIGHTIKTQYAEVNGSWYIQGKTIDHGNSTVDTTYGTSRVNAYRLLEDALNLKETKIYDTVKTPDGETRVLNKKETMLAQQKQEMLRNAFKEWIFKDISRRESLCRKYNELFNSIRPREYDGSHIRFVGMTPEITLMPHQKNAVAHMLYGGNTLLAHCVGAGKTFEMIAAGMESKRLGLSQKNLYVVPNHLTEQWGADFLRLYPGANILVATKKDFEPANRKRFCSRIATGSYDAVIIGHSQFEKIPLSKERQIATIQAQIDEITSSIETMGRRRSESFSIKQMEKTRKTLQTKLARLNDQSRKDDVVTFEQLGVDRLFVDESHNYKNLFLYTKMQNVAGIQQTDAQKSSDMFMKCRYMDELTGGKGVTFATGTPISNSMVELYTVMRYLQYDTLQKMGLGHFDSWAASFGDTVTAIELAPEGTGYRAKTRFARFYNLPELISVFREAADVQTPDMLKLPVPKAEFVNQVLKPSEEQKELVSSFSDRAEQVRSGSVDPRMDNMLKITNDGRKCALDQRLVNDLLPDADMGKVNSCVQNAFRVWQEGIPQKTTQLIFCDLSTPKADGSFNVYSDVREKLIAKGVPEKEIAFIHDADTETKKAELFSKVRSGQVRILLGSTPKLGAGTNVQDRLIALHHLDAPWKPSDLEQQEGRILRQGNMNEQVQIFRYVTEGTFDAYMWQLLENKQKFISQIMTSKSPVRSCEDVDDTALSYAEIKALATGNPYIKEKMDLDIQVSKLKMLKANHVSQQYRLESDIARSYPTQIAATQQRIANLTADIVTAQSALSQGSDHFVMTVSGKAYIERKEAGMAILKACAAAKNLHSEMPIGEYSGFAMKASYDLFSNQFELTLHGHGNYTVEIGSDPTGNIIRLNNVLEALPKHLAETRLKLGTLNEQLENAKLEVQRPFPQEKELAEKQERLTELNSMLNMDEHSSEAAVLEDTVPEENAAEDTEQEQNVHRRKVIGQTL